MAVDYFLDLGTDYPGESIDSKHSGQIQVQSFSWGGSQQSSVYGSSGSGAGKVSLADFTISKVFDKASPKLLGAMSKGTHIAKGTLYAVKAGGAGAPYLTVEFDQLFVTSLSFSAAGEVPMESVTFSYGSLNMTYATQSTKGIMETAGTWGYNLETNETTA